MTGPRLGPGDGTGDAAEGGTGGRGTRVRTDRGLSTLLSLVTAIAVLTITLAGTMVIVEDAFRDSVRDDAERAVAIQAADRLVAVDGPVADGQNVLNASRLATLAEPDLRAVGASDRFGMAVAVDGERVEAVGDPDGGTTVRRIALVADRQPVTRTPALGGRTDPTVTLPVRTDRLTLRIDPPPGVDVTGVRSGDRLVLQNASGLAGEHRIHPSPYRTLSLGFETTGPLSTGDVELVYGATDRERVTLAVTVDDTGRRAAGGGSP